VIPATLAAILLAGQGTPAPPAEGNDIVVTAVRNRCSVRLADKVLSSPDFDAHAAEWARGRPVRVTAPADADVKCLTKIAMRLARHGVTRIEFPEPKPPAP